jgi:hypothetical protein
MSGHPRFAPFAVQTHNVNWVDWEDRANVLVSQGRSIGRDARSLDDPEADIGALVSFAFAAHLQTGKSTNCADPCSDAQSQLAALHPWSPYSIYISQSLIGINAGSFGGKKI